MCLKTYFDIILSTENKEYITLDELCFKLKKHGATVVKANVERQIKHHIDLIQIKEDVSEKLKKAISLIGVLEYVFKQSKSIPFCNTIAHAVLNTFQNSKELTVTNQDLGTLLELYNDIASSNLRSNILQNALLNECDIDEDAIPSLFSGYKSKFEHDAWQTIVLFEYNFSKYNADVVTGHDSIKERWTYFHSLQKIQEASRTALMKAKENISINQESIKDRETERAPYLTAASRHLATEIEQGLNEEFNLYTLKHIKTIICTDSEASPLENSLILCLEVDARYDRTQIEDVVNISNYFLKNKHLVECARIIVVPDGSLDRYKNARGVISRYMFRDDYLSTVSQYSASILSLALHHQVVENDIDVDGTTLHCKACFRTSLRYPQLRPPMFNLLQDWVLEVPFEIQIWLESFINQYYLKRADNKNEYLEKRLLKLKNAYDILLNVSNSKYFGSQQIKNTEQLILGYKTVTDVFNITSKAGISTGKSFASDHIIELAKDDNCYFNAYLKHHPLAYTDVHDIPRQSTRMRDCYSTFMLDNLVRLKHVDDPTPGESHSKQMAMLPCGLQGLPVDHAVCIDWHAKECPDKRDPRYICECKKPRELTVDDVKPSLTELTNHEQIMKERFDNLCIWGNSLLWKDIENSILWKQIQLAINDTSHSEGGSSNRDVELCENADDIEISSAQLDEMLTEIAITESFCEKNQEHTDLVNLMTGQTDDQCNINSLDSNSYSQAFPNNVRSQSESDSSESDTQSYDYTSLANRLSSSCSSDMDCPDDEHTSQMLHRNTPKPHQIVLELNKFTQETQPVTLGHYRNATEPPHQIILEKSHQITPEQCDQNNPEEYQINPEQHNITLDQPHENITDKHPTSREEYRNTPEQLLKNNPEQLHQTTPELYRFIPEHEITPDQHQAIPEQHQITPEQYQITPEQHQIISEQHQIISEQHQITPEQQKIAPEQHKITPEQHQITPEQQKIAPEQQKIAPEQHKITPEQHKITPEHHQNTPEQQQQVSIKSKQKVSLIHVTPEAQQQIPEAVPTQFGLNKYYPPPLICTHPTPYTGRDDELGKLRQILDDVLTKMGHYNINDILNAPKIIFGPDHKIGNNLMKLLNDNNTQKYKAFLPEFPCLHMRKSFINSTVRSYADAGMIELLRILQSDDTQDWTKLISLEHIDAATRNVKRLAKGFHVAFLIEFMRYLDTTEAKLLLHDLQTMDESTLSTKWRERYSKFIKLGKTANATFSLHADMMSHLDDCVAISLAERLGGIDGYALLTGTVKHYLPFGFVNQASSYGPYCTMLLHEKEKAGLFYENMKATLFSTPIGNSQVNFATDTKREMDHIKVVKAFRSGATVETVSRRMAVIDILGTEETERDKEDDLGWRYTQKDSQHILPVAEVICRTGGISTKPEQLPLNVYGETEKILTPSILDENSYPAGHHMLQRYVCKQGLFSCSEKDLPDPNSVEGPKDIQVKVKRSTGITLKRNALVKISNSSQINRREQSRLKLVARETKRMEGFTSSVNMCQALVNPDTSKRTVNKSKGIPKALSAVLSHFQCEQGLVKDFKKTEQFPTNITSKVTFIAIEFAGVKFMKGASKSASVAEYVKSVESSVIRPVMATFPEAKKLVVCEEKYSFTPDIFKAATRSKRKAKNMLSQAHYISHLLNENMNGDTVAPKTMVRTTTGRAHMSKWLAKNAHKLILHKSITITFDSELHLDGHSSSCKTEICTCGTKYAVPIECVYSGNQHAPPMIRKVHDVIQRKGEGEMALADWLLSSTAHIQEGQAVASYVTSGDIDALVIHLFFVSLKWPRNETGCFLYPVYLILSKAGTNTVYNITKIVEEIEGNSGVKHMAAHLAVYLCMGGNDFIPNFKGKTHASIIQEILKKFDIYKNLLIISPDCAILNKEVFTQLIKELYRPKRLPAGTTYNEVAKATMISKGQYTNPDGWLPPESVVCRVGTLIELQMQYLMSAGCHEADLPDFMQSGCFKKENEIISYDFGPDSYHKIHMTAPTVTLDNRTPQKTPTGAKRILSVTPRKFQKRQKKI